MDNAGRAVADAVMKRGEGDVLVMCGPGNNGGDGIVAARYIKGKRVHLFLSKAQETEAKLHEELEAVGNLIVKELPKAGKGWVIVDALLGVGIRGEPREPYASLIQYINRCREEGSYVISVDVPSGFPTSLAVRPQITVTMHDAKEGMNPENSGEIVVADIGIPKDAVDYTGPGEMLLYPVPSSSSHKGNNGIVTVIGGGAFSGSTVFSSLAAYRTGADLVYTIVPRSSYSTVAAFSPNLMVFHTKQDFFAIEDLEAVMPWVKRSGAIVIGPGMEVRRESEEFTTRLLQESTVPSVVDAGAIEIVGKTGVRRRAPTVYTPHAREFEKLTGEKVCESLEERKAQVMRCAGQLGGTILLKGVPDVISDGKRVKLNRTGNAGMTVGGTGDVLTGEVAELLAKGCSPFDAARVAAFINGTAGSICFVSKSYGLLATDVIEAIPTVLERYL